MNDKRPNADSGSASSNAGDHDEVEKIDGLAGGGQSGGGAYANPHAGKDGGKDGYMGSGGQTEMPYHGTGQLGTEQTGGNANAPAGASGEEAGRDRGEDRRG